MHVTHGRLLGGRVRYDQPACGWRTAIEPVLLAAAVPARPGERVLEAGTGAGAGLLCLLARVSHVTAVGIELDPDMAALARSNAAANDMEATIHAADVAEAARFGPVDHAFANPPWHDPAGTPPVGAGRVLAKQRAEGGLAAWVHPLAAALTRRGTLSLILPASMCAEAMGELTGAGLAAVTLFPLWPKRDVPAKLVVLQGRRGAARTRVLPGLVLHEGGGGYSEPAEAVLRDGRGLEL